MIKCDAKKSSDGVTVTFSLAEDGLDGQWVAVVGDFNDWDPTATPMVKKGRRRTAALVMPPGQRHAFRYVSEEGEWLNDDAAHAYEPNGFGGDNSILDLRHGSLTHARR